MYRLYFCIKRTYMVRKFMSLYILSFVLSFLKRPSLDVQYITADPHNSSHRYIHFIVNNKYIYIRSREWDASAENTFTYNILFMCRNVDIDRLGVIVLLFFLLIRTELYLIHNRIQKVYRGIRMWWVMSLRA